MHPDWSRSNASRVGIEVRHLVCNPQPFVGHHPWGSDSNMRKIRGQIKGEQVKFVRQGWDFLRSLKSPDHREAGM